MKFGKGAIGLLAILFFAVTLLPYRQAAAATPPVAPTSKAAPAPAAPAVDTNADRTLNLVTSPLPINLRAAPGSTISTDLLIKNGSTYSENLKVSLMKFTAYGDQGKPAIQERQQGDDYFDWVKFSENTFTAPPNKWVTIKMTVTVPQKAAFGYYYAAVFSRAGAPGKAASGQNTVLGSSAVLILLAVDQPGARRTAAVNNFTADKHIYEYLPATFSVKIRNSGNVHLIPTGNIFITRGKSPVATLKVNAANRNVLPGSNRVFTTDWEDGFPAYLKKEAGGQVILDKDDKPITELTWDLSKISHLRIGKYTAHLLMAYDDGKSDVPIESTLTFWVIPWRLILVGIAIPVIPAILVYLWSNWRFKRRMAKFSAAEAAKASASHDSSAPKPTRKASKKS